MKRAVPRRARATAAWVAASVLAVLLALLHGVAAAQVPPADRVPRARRARTPPRPQHAWRR